MLKLISRWQLHVGLVCIVLISTACFQAVGDVPQGNIVSERSTETHTPIPPTDIPTEEVEAQADDQLISDLDTETPTETATATATDTPEPTLVSTQVAQDEPDPFELTSTALIQNATAVVLTQEEQARRDQGIFPETETPFVEPTLEDFFLTLTATVLVQPGQPQPTQPILTGADCVHEVRAGENLYRISTTYYGVAVNTVAARNGIVNINLISIGQRLIIPGCGTTGFFPPPTSTPIPVNTPFGQGGAFVTQDPGTGGGFATSIPVSTSTCGGQYIVQQYDSLFQISLACSVPVQSIANANGIGDINYIKMGDILTIPPG